MHTAHIIRRSRLVVMLALASIAALASTLLAPTAAHAAATHHSVDATRTWIKGKQTKPSSYSHNQYVVITGSHVYGSLGCGVPTYEVDDVLHDNTTLADRAPTISKTAAATDPAGVAPCGIPGAQPNDWWNPASWNWGGILGDAWNKIWNGCVQGALSSTVGTASGTLAINLLARGGKIFVGPEGYAAIAIGGCVVGLIW